MFSHGFICFQVVDCAKLIKVPLHKGNDGIKDLNVFMRDFLEEVEKLVVDFKASGKQYYAFRNT